MLVLTKTMYWYYWYLYLTILLLRCSLETHWSYSIKDTNKQQKKKERNQIKNNKKTTYIRAENNILFQLILRNMAIAAIVKMVETNQVVASS